MALPAHRSTSSKRKRRASHFALKKINLATCPKCKHVRKQHTACQNCGTYAGRQVVKMENPLEKKAKPAKEKVEKPAKAEKKTAKKDDAKATEKKAEAKTEKKAGKSEAKE